MTHLKPPDAVLLAERGTGSIWALHHLRSMQSSSTDGDTGSGGEATCPVSVATHLTLMTSATAL